MPCDRRSRFHHRAVLALLGGSLLAGGCAGSFGSGATAAARVTLTGIASFAPGGEAWLVDCANGALRTRIGATSAGNERYFRRRVEELEGRERKPVTAQLSGYLRAEGDERVLDQPALIWLSAGHCTEPSASPVERKQ